VLEIYTDYKALGSLELSIKFEQLSP